jgi:hypothetical protein
MFYIGETFVDGQQRDVWCDSKIPITDMKMHCGGSRMKDGSSYWLKAASCYIAYYNTGNVGLLLSGDNCLLKAMQTYYVSVFLCA